MSEIWSREEEVRRLQARFDRLKSEEKVSQALFARMFKVPGGASMITQHLKMTRPINLEQALAYAKGFKCTVGEISPRLDALVNEGQALNVFENRFMEVAKAYGFLCNRLTRSDKSLIPEVIRLGAGSSHYIPDFALYLEDHEPLFVEVKSDLLANSETTIALKNLSEAYPDKFRLLIVKGANLDQEYSDFFFSLLAHWGRENTVADEMDIFVGAKGGRSSAVTRLPRDNDSTLSHLRDALRVLADAIATIEVQNRSALGPILGTITIAPDSNDVIEAIATHIENSPKRAVTHQEKQQAPAENQRASRAA